MEKIVKIKSIKKLDKKFDRYDLTVSGTSNFYANNVLIHNTSTIAAKLHVKEPKKLPIHKLIWNKFIDATGLFKDKRVIDYNIVYGPIFSSRKVIKNQYINKEVSQGYYVSDIWSEYGEIVYPYLDEGMSVYGEIYGYVTGTQSMIQKNYAYDCKEGENKLMLYRITTINEDGSKKEWNVAEVYDWTLKLIERMKEANDENWKRIHPIDILFHGTLADLYPEVDTESHWRENVLEKLKNDKEHFGMEEYEPLCLYQKVPREGIVVRIDDDPIPEAFKLKTTSFKLAEALLYDDVNYVDIEVQEGDYNQDVTPGES